MNLEEKGELDLSSTPIRNGWGSLPEKEKAPMNMSGKKRLNKIACLFLKNIFKKTLDKCNCKEVII